MLAIHGTLGGNSKYNDKEIYENLCTHQSNEKLKSTQIFMYKMVKHKINLSMVKIRDKWAFLYRISVQTLLESYLAILHPKSS